MPVNDQRSINCGPIFYPWEGGEVEFEGEWYKNEGCMVMRG